jgi:acetyl-CoA carboxylase biotin carboxyl carrier protein
VSLKEIKDMIRLMNENDLSELEFEREGLKIRLRKDGVPQMAPIVTHHSLPHPASSVPTLADASSRPQEADPSIVEIKSPIVGTFYRAPAPDAPAFCEEGQEIKEGQVLCIVEAMKLMNEIKSEIKGTIKEILIKNGEPVEFDQPLFKVKV